MTGFFLQAQYNYPYALVGSPAYQVRAACEALKEPGLQGAALLKAMLTALNTFSASDASDTSAADTCFELEADIAYPTSTFDYQVWITILYALSLAC